MLASVYKEKTVAELFIFRHLSKSQGGFSPMAMIQPFHGLRSAEAYAASIAALPYDVYNRAEAKKIVADNPMSFLKIDRAETQFPDTTDLYAPEVYARARDTLQEMIGDGAFIREDSACFYLYALTMNGRTQNGIVGCASIDDYLNNVIRKHENTREEKELDRIRHVDVTSAQTGPIFLAYRPEKQLSEIIRTIRESAPLYDFVSEDGVRHQLWKIDQPDRIETIRKIFSGIEHIYIADGHHRAASAVKVGLKRRAEHPGYDSTEEFNYFLSVLFPADELCIYDYNRVVDGLNGYTFDTLLEKLKDTFLIEKTGTFRRPLCKGELALYGNNSWYSLKIHSRIFTGDPVADLDVSVLQDHVLAPLLGIRDPKTDDRIHFVGGIRGTDELVRLADTPDRIAFAMYPTSMEELLSVADAGRLMPPKSTWFEPKLRSGLLIHEIER